MCEREEKPLVIIRSLVYNHEPYLRDCLEGFVMQQTTFPFVAVVHDDCSTDNSAAIIREYAEKYPHIIKPVYETENQYSKHDGSLRRVMNEACGKYGAKYYALCEGDDYWTDPHKLQKQVDFLERNPDYILVCCDGVMKVGERLLTTHEDFCEYGWPHRKEEGEMSTEELICQGGRYLFTCSMLFRAGLREGFPNPEISPAHRPISTGDYSVQVLAAISGKVYYMAEKMIFYRRFSTPDAWSSKNTTGKPTQSTVQFWCNDINMLTYMDELSKGRHSSIIRPFQHKMLTGMMKGAPEWVPMLLSKVGYVLEYAYQEVAHPANKGGISGILFMVGRFLHRPYYPAWDSRAALIPALRVFCKESGNRLVFHLGPVHIVSVVPDEPVNRIFLLGKRIR